MNYLFIGGCGRSGTSLLQDLLVQHSRIAGSSELNFCKSIMHLKRRMQSRFFLDRNRDFYSREELDHIFSDFLKMLLDNVGKKKPGSGWISEKTPENIFVINDLLETFPTARFIYVYRDGRDVLGSHLEVERRGQDSNHALRMRTISVAKLWNSCAYHRLETRPEFKDRVFDVKYEDLITTPGKVVSSLLSFLGLSDEDLVTKRKVAPTTDTIIEDGVWYDNEKKTSEIIMHNSNKWRSRLNFYQRIVSNLVMAHYLQRYQYTVNPAYVRLNQWLRKIS